MERFNDIWVRAALAVRPGSFAPQGSSCRTLKGGICRICWASRLSYEDEVQAKQTALQEFWSATIASCPLDPLIPSPHGRGYRTVSKRKLFHAGRDRILGLIDPEGESGGAVPVLQCAIEPDWHAAVYRRVGELLARPQAGALQEMLQYVVLKGNDQECTAVLTVRQIERDVVKAANTVSKGLTASGLPVAGVFLYEDDSGGRYYLGTRTAGAPGKLLRLYGPKTLSHRTAGRRFVYGPLAFSQVNQGMLDTMVEQSALLLGTPISGTLYDLYCGYGLFGLSLAGRVRGVVGADISPDAIAAAQENARHFALSQTRFVRNNLTAAAVHGLLRQCRQEDRVLLDPPRGGTAEGVLETIAASGPGRAVHIFCNIDLVSAEVNRWQTSGYTLARAVPVDMFPGTSTVEILAAFSPA
jgi:23S rRNA (uracil1939-C5)-methyltransferase